VTSTGTDGSTPTSPRITSLDDLHAYLYSALQLEHATLPPYLTALYSLHNGTNSDAWHILRVVAVEEMLHLSLAANVMNATGGSPDLTRPGFVPAYPASLPDGETDFTVDLQPLSPTAVETFLKIERPAQAPNEQSRLLPRARSDRTLLAASPTEPGMQFYSIGEFYREISRGVEYLHGQYAREGKELFTGDPGRQVTPEYFYSGGGEAIVVTDLESALDALNFIAEQGEGLGGGIYDVKGELAHYYRFEQLQLGHYYLKGDQPGKPSGPAFDIDWTAVYPSLKNARLADYPENSEVYHAARAFNDSYADFLEFLTSAFTGQPALLLDAVPRMMRFRDEISRLIRNPAPGRPGVHAAPTFELGGEK
jgi:Ferritin-like